MSRGEGRQEQAVRMSAFRVDVVKAGQARGPSNAEFVASLLQIAHGLTTKIAEAEARGD